MRWLLRVVIIAGMGLVVVWPSRAPATITEQRQRLPPPAQCGDDLVEGIWKAHKYDPRFGEWIIFTLHIRRTDDDPDRLRGTITNHSWAGGPQDQEPPPCRPGGAEWVVDMDGEGDVSPSGQIRFYGVGQWRLARRICPNPRWSGYNLDHFRGLIDPELNEFQTHNNDGGRDINVPYVFRRIQCFPEDSEVSPRVETVPPPFQPPQQAGCSCL